MISLCRTPKRPPSRGAARQDWIEVAAAPGAGIAASSAGAGVPKVALRSGALAWMKPLIRECRRSWRAPPGAGRHPEPRRFAEDAEQTVQLIEAVDHPGAASFWTSAVSRQGDPHAEIARLIPHAVSWQLEKRRSTAARKSQPSMETDPGSHRRTWIPRLAAPSGRSGQAIQSETHAAARRVRELSGRAGSCGGARPAARCAAGGSRTSLVSEAACHAPRPLPWRPHDSTATLCYPAGASSSAELIALSTPSARTSTPCAISRSTAGSTRPQPPAPWLLTHRAARLPADCWRDTAPGGAARGCRHLGRAVAAAPAPREPGPGDVVLVRAAGAAAGATPAGFP